MNNSPFNSPEHYAQYRKYGFVKSAETECLKESDAVEYTLFNSDGSSFSFDDYHLAAESYSFVFKEVGFKSFRWQQVEVSAEGLEMYGREYRIGMPSGSSSHRSLGFEAVD